MYVSETLASTHPRPPARRRARMHVFAKYTDGRRVGVLSLGASAAAAVAADELQAPSRVRDRVSLFRDVRTTLRGPRTARIHKYCIRVLAPYVR